MVKNQNAPTVSFTIPNVSQVKIEEGEPGMSSVCPAVEIVDLP
jgi:hypothetical protein